MDFKTKIEGFATHQVISLILDLLGRSSDENLIRLTFLGEKLTSDEEVLSGIAGGRRYFHLNAKGDVEPCVYTHIATDNIRSTTLAKALDSPLFRSIRARQPHNANHLRPCMIIDNPHVMRELIDETKPYFTHPGAEEIYTTKSHEMDAYANRFAQFADWVWQNGYIKEQSKRNIREAEEHLAESITRAQRDSIGATTMQLSAKRENP